VESRVGQVAYKLKLPDHSKVHLVLYVSLLKKVIGSAPIRFSLLPKEPSAMQTPEMVMDRRVHNKAHRTSYQLLIKWKNSPAELATWEEEDEIIRLFPEFTAWGQADANGGGNVIVRKVPASPEGKRSKRARKPNPKFPRTKLEEVEEAQAQLLLVMCCWKQL